MTILYYHQVLSSLKWTVRNDEMQKKAYTSLTNGTTDLKMIIDSICPGRYLEVKHNIRWEGSEDKLVFLVIIYMTMHSGQAAVSYQSEIPYIWLKNWGHHLNIWGMCQNFDQSSQKVLEWVDLKDINTCLNFRLCIRMEKIWYFKTICKFSKNISCETGCPQ